MNPVDQSIRTAIQRLPDAAFKRDPDERREALFDKLDSLNEMMAKGNYGPARRKLERDVRDKVEKWIRADYETGPLQRTKSELLSLIDEMLNRLEVSTGTDRGNGQRGGNGGIDG